MKKVDARGCACPEPVMMTREAMEEDPTCVEVTVDNVCAVENIKRFAGNFGYTVEIRQDGGDTTLTLTKK